MFVILPPFALAMYVVAASSVQSAPELSRTVKLAFHIVHMVLLIAFMALIWSFGAYDVLACGLFFCVGPVTYEEFENQASEHGTDAMIGLAIFLTCLVVLVGHVPPNPSPPPRLLRSRISFALIRFPVASSEIK